MGVDVSRVSRWLRVVVPLGVVVLMTACAAPNVKAQAANPLDEDAIFVNLRNAARLNNAPLAAQLAAQIPDYPVPSYVEYFRIKPQMFDSGGRALIDAPDDQIQSFLARYNGLAIADRMTNDYLLVLGARRDWRHFDALYPHFALDDDTQVKCYALESRASREQPVGDAARALLVDPKAYGDGCLDLINVLAQQGQWSSDDVWAQMRLAVENGMPGLARQLASALGPQRPGDPQLDRALNQSVQFLLQPLHVNTPAHQLALLAVTQMAVNDPAATANLYPTVVASLTPLEQAIGWGVIAYRGALRQLPGTADWYRRSAGAPLSNNAYEWRVRTALVAGDWQMVRWSIESMPLDLRQREAWVYWHGRALQALGDPQGAAQNFQTIAPRFTFYGQLSTEALGGQIILPPRTVVSDAEVAQMHNVPGFALAQRFYDMNLRFEGNREWNWALRGMSDRQLLAAARYALTLPLYDRVVNTADRTESQFDFSLRYLSPFRDIVERDARRNGLDVEWAYGLIRQESRFIISAQSGVGASGLMQLMPATARMVARQLGMSNLSPDQINDIDTNILLGTTYLANIYNQFDGSAVLASAGYNAGPGRPRQWRAALPRPVEGAIFAESIPFNETRDYVKNVLANTIYYAALFEGRPQSLRARLGVITPQ